MEEKVAVSYNPIARAIDFIKQSMPARPDLDRVAEKMHISPSGLRKSFNDWAGVTPETFFQSIKAKQAEVLPKDEQPSLFEHTVQKTKSGPSHDSRVKITAMKEKEAENGGVHLFINYSFSESPFGQVIIASTAKGVCFMAFEEEREKAIRDLNKTFPNAHYRESTDTLQQEALKIFEKDWRNLSKIKLHLKGTDFQIMVWEHLLKIPVGELTTYQKLATEMGRPEASRAVGTAIGSNSVAYIIPCHRVVRTSGEIGGFKWGGSTRKIAIIGWEAAKAGL